MDEKAAADAPKSNAEGGDDRKSKEDTVHELDEDDDDDDIYDDYHEQVLEEEKNKKDGDDPQGQPVGGVDAPEEAVLVSEFPPPPFYYKLAKTAPELLEPPPIPHAAFRRAAKRVAKMAAEAKAEAERVRLAELGITPDPAASSADTDGSKGDATMSQAKDDEEDDGGEVVAVFGEIVEDPLLVQVEDECENPKIIQETLGRLNREVMRGFVKLVNELVHRPLDNKKYRDELSHNIFLMVQECNKFREHQARELLISSLESQLRDRKRILEQLQASVRESEVALQNYLGAAPPIAATSAVKDEVMEDTTNDTTGAMAEDKQESIVKMEDVQN